MSTLLDLIQTKVNYVVQEAIVVIKDIFRKYPNKCVGILRDADSPGCSRSYTSSSRPSLCLGEPQTLGGMKPPEHRWLWFFAAPRGQCCPRGAAGVSEVVPSPRMALWGQSQLQALGWRGAARDMQVPCVSRNCPWLSIQLLVLEQGQQEERGGNVPAEPG